jgi:ribosomal protein L11 methylase PrmA
VTRRNGASYRDPSGFIFHRAGRLYRQVNCSYADEYDRLMSSGLYDDLVSRSLLISHEQADLHLAAEDDAYRVLAPERLPFISYPHEWSFGQLKDAALLTLDVQERALDHGLVLKDASARNVQFQGSRPVFIDTLSFATYREGEPWVAYRQFCEQFLAPLALMSRVDARLGVLQRPLLDGVPLQLASRALPFMTRLRPSLLLHVHLHARSIDRFGRREIKGSRFDRPISRKAMQGLVQSLRDGVGALSWDPEGTEWSDYDHDIDSDNEYRRAKEDFVRSAIQEHRPDVVWDLGANTGRFSRLAATEGARVVSIDSDPGAVEMHYRRLRNEQERRVTPILVDLLNPTPGCGWAGEEIESLQCRGPADLLLALALVHHLAIGRNVPLTHIAEWLSRITRRLVVEFVPKDDPQAQKLLVSRKDVFQSYDRQSFEDAFRGPFQLLHQASPPSGQRMLYVFEARSTETTR